MKVFPFLRRTLPVLLLLLPGLARTAAATEGGYPGGGPGYPLEPGVWRLHGFSPALPTDDLEPLRRKDHRVAGDDAPGLVALPAA